MRRKKPSFLILGVFYMILGVCACPQERINLHYLLFTAEIINTLVIIPSVKIVVRLFMCLGLTLGCTFV